MDINKLQTDFSANKYAVIKSLFPSETAAVYAKEFELYFRRFNGLHDEGDIHVQSAQSIYAPPIGESMMHVYKPLFEQITNIKLVPTYSYGRIYHPGSHLRRHYDRSACEISITVCLGYNKLPPPINFESREDNTKTFSVIPEPGDAVIYRGIDLWHWRDPIPPNHNLTHVFLHFVPMDMKNQNIYFDKRPGIGYDFSSKSDYNR